jgi:hypothetical protein
MLYQPSQVPTNPADYQRFMREELDKIAAALRLVADGHIDPTYAAPDKPRQGDIRYADGTLWNPGGGEGIYFFNSGGVWVQMG